MVATDRDLGFNGALLYVISEGDVDCAFSLDAVTGDLAVAGFLDRERTPDYILNVTVYDQGLPQKSASKLIRVAVDDMNDNRPRFVKSTFSFFFPENTSPGTPVVTLNATDPDSGAYGRVTYSLETETDSFELDPESGLLVVSKELDREAREFYDLTIRATDGDELRPLSSTAVVRVRVLDVNDVAPLFTSRQYLVKAREDLPVGSVVGMVHAHDPDLYQGGEVRFSVVPDQSSYAADGMAAEDVFEVDEVSGTVRIRAALDYEQKQLFNLTIGASDLGSPSLSSAASFIVEVLDVNENLHAPKFSSYFFRTSVQENLPSGSHVAQVTAEDLDGDDTDDGRLSYSIRGGDGLGSFIVDEEGNIRTLAVLDTESKDHYWLTVHATDHGAVPLSSKLFVYVEVQDTNDNAPLTVDPIYFASVSESAKPFSRVTTVEAEDSDSEKLTYAIVAGNPQSMFHVDPNTGILSTTKRLLDR